VTEGVERPASRRRLPGWYLAVCGAFAAGLVAWQLLWPAPETEPAAAGAYRAALLGLADAEVALARCGEGRGEAGVVAEIDAAPRAFGAEDMRRLVELTFSAERYRGAPCDDLLLPAHRTAAERHRVALHELQ
jgi:hypothetical protein